MPIEKVCQCCRTGILGLNRYGWVTVDIFGCWALTLHVPGILSSIKAALGRRHRHCCTPVFLWLMPYQASMHFPSCPRCLWSTESAQSWLQLLGADVGWETSFCCVLHSHTCSAHGVLLSLPSLACPVYPGSSGHMAPDVEHPCAGVTALVAHGQRAQVMEHSSQ